MSKFLRGLGLVSAVCGALLVLTLTFVVIKKVWIGKSGGRGHVTVLKLDGIIIDASSFLKEIKSATDSSSTKAIVVQVDSPGGLVAPSQEIYHALLQADKKVPVVISMASLAASGGYYAAIAGRKIFANPGTLTASIGVIMEFANTEKLYQWAKVDRFNLKAGKFKDTGSPFRPMTPEDKALLTGLLNNIHSQFRAAVQERRQLTEKELDAVADGRVMTGHQAKLGKLVDELGGLEDAIAEAKKMANLGVDAPVTYPETEMGLLRRLILGDQKSSLAEEVLSVLPPFPAGLRPGWRILLLAPTR